MSANSLPPSNLPVSLYLFKTCKLWVWDFDDTLINTEAYLRRDMKTSTIRNLTDSDLDTDFPQWRYFAKLIEYLTTHGKYVGIASFGTYEIIRAYMDRVLGFNQKTFGRNNIIAPCLQDRDNRRFSIPPNKNEYMYQLMKIYRVQDFGRVVLFDDLPSNISGAISIGVVGIQIATPRNGDIDANKMYFGPWIMIDIDKKLENSCCKDEIDETNIVDCANKSKAKLVTSQPFFGDKYPYGKSAYGTGIGDRRISKKPENRWNKMNVQNPPLWQNGNWQTCGGSTSMESFPESSLGGFSVSFWENDQSVINKNIKVGGGVDGSNSRNYGNDGTYYGNDNIDDDNTVNYKNINSSRSSSRSNFIEGFQNSSINNDNIKKVSNYNNKYRKDKFMDSDNCESCKKITWNWITLCLMLIIFMMIALCFSVM